jgi:hypothetical protein
MPTGADFSALAVDPAFPLPPVTAACPDWSRVPMYLPSGRGTRADPYVPMPGYGPYNVPALAGRQYIQPQAPFGWYRHPTGTLYAWHVPWWRDGTDVRWTPITGPGIGGSETNPLPSLESMLAVWRPSPYGAPMAPLPGYYFRHGGEILFLDAGGQGGVWDAEGNIRTEEVLPTVEPAVDSTAGYWGGS